jgi:hypothetical protein
MRRETASSDACSIVNNEYPYPEGIVPQGRESVNFLEEFLNQGLVFDNHRDWSLTDTFM